MDRKYKIACAIITNQNGDLLLTKRGREPFKGKWSLISGIGESLKGISPDIGVIEEVHCDIGTNSYKPTHVFTLALPDDPRADEIFVFAGTINESEINIQPEFSQGYKWVPRNNREEFRDMAFNHEEIIKRYLSLS